MNSGYVAAFWLNQIFFLLYIVSAIFVIYRLRCKIDRSSFLTIFLYICCFTVRMVTMIVAIFMDPENKLIKYVVVVDLTVTVFPVLAIVFLTFEMRVVYLKLEANCYEEFLKWHSRNYLIRNLIILCIVLLVFLNCYFYWHRFISLSKLSGGSKFVVFVDKTVAFCVEIFIIRLVSKYFNYFVEKKQEILLDNGKDFSVRTFRIITYAKFLIFLNVIDILSRYCETFFLFSDTNDVRNVDSVIVYERYLWIPTVTFLDGTILVYMIYSQG